MEEGVVFTSPEKDIEFYEIKGRDGDVSLNNQRLKSVTRPFPVTLFPIDGSSLSEQANKISNWLKQNDGAYTTLTIDDEPEYEYRAVYYEQYNLEQFMVRYGKAVLNFRVMPYKFLKAGLTERVLDESITNPLGRSSKPKLTIKGSGDITINIGDSVLTLKNVDGGVIVDSLYQTVTTLNGQAQAWDKVTSYPLPTIAPGRQNITTTGNVTEIKIIPRWEAIV